MIRKQINKLLFDFSNENLEEIINKRRTGFIFLTGIMSITTLIIMGIISFFEQENVLFLVDFTAATILITMLFIFIKTKKTEIISTFGIVFIGLFFTFLLIYGGQHKSAFVWLYLFPFIAMFLHGHKKGLYYSLTMLLICIIYFIIPINFENVTVYSPDFEFRFSISLFLLIILTYFSETSVQKALRIIKEKNSKDLELYAQIFNQAKESFIITDSTGKIINANNHFLKIAGLTKKELIGEPITSLNYCKINPKKYLKMLNELNKNNFWSSEFDLCMKEDQKPISIKINISTLKKNGKIKYFIITVHDISHFKYKEKILYKKAFYDNLTHLPNKSYCMKEIKSMINIATRRKSKFAVLFLDLDNFKNINDTKGHPVGDKLLIKVAEKLKELLRNSDVVCRLGGDEFLIALEFNDNLRYLYTVCERILSEFEKPFIIDNINIYAGISIGIAIFPNNGFTVETLIKNADIAMYKSKMKGKNTFSFFTDEDQQELNYRIDIENKVEKAIQNNKLFLEYQQIFDNNISEIVGYEAFVRLKYENETLYPGDFIPYIEGTPVISKMTNEIIKIVCKDIPKFRKHHTNKIFISINIPEEYLTWEGSLDYLENIFKAHKIKRGEIEFEFKENAILKHASNVFKMLIKYNNLGINLSIDDFGTGFSSLQSIQSLKINKLKIDKVFVNDMEYSSTDRDFCKTIIDIAYNLNIAAVAEGVEKQSHIGILKEMKCHYLQGYLLGKPKKIEDIINNEDYPKTEEILT